MMIFTISIIIAAWTCIGASITFDWDFPKNFKQLILLNIIMGPILGLFAISLFLHYKLVDKYSPKFLSKIKNFYHNL